MAVEQREVRPPSVDEGGPDSKGLRAPADVSPGRRIWKALTSDNALRVYTLIGVVTVWELIGRSASTVTFASFSRTAEAMIGLWESGELLKAWSADLAIMLSGLALAAVTGTVMGFILGRYRLLDRFFAPAITGLFVTPKIALLPMIMLWLGFQTTAKILVVFLFTYFEVFFTIRDGVRTVDKEYVEVSRAYMIPDGMVLRKVVAPATLPFVVTALRLGLLHGLVGVVLAGFFLEATGIGGLISHYSSGFRLAEVFSVIITVMVVGITINLFLRFAERRIAPWNERQPA